MNLKSLAVVPLLAIIILMIVASVTTTASAAPAPNPSQHYVEYRNAVWHFSLFVPDDWEATNYAQPGGTTIQFTDATGDEQFQISAWPYKDLVVHTDGFRVQPPSSDGDVPDELGTVHVFHTDLFEITFVKNGMSYNVQAFPDHATSTLSILKSWQFI
jgi:hypothetical protein